MPSKDTQFKKGQSGNPAGPKPGQTKTIHAKFRQAICEKTPEIIDVLIEQALNGDTAASTLLLSKVPPNMKNEPITFNIGASLAETGGNILEGISTDQVDVSSGLAILTGLASLVRVQESTDLVKRIEALEKSHD